MVVDTTNPTNNITVGTTFWKFLFQGNKLLVWLASSFCHLGIFFHIDDFFGLGVWSILIATLLDIGVTLIVITSVIEWRNAKKKLKADA